MLYSKNTACAAYAAAALLLVACCVFMLSYGPAFASGIELDQGRQASLKSQGKASWYGTTAHGKLTANGEIYNRYALTAAHKGLPFGTVVRVHNLQNGKHVLVRINDRGPFVQGRIVDVSFKAAQVLDMVHTGIVPVHLEIISCRQGELFNDDNAFYVHIADAKSALKARSKAAKLSRHLDMQVKTLYRPDRPDESGKAFALGLGPFEDFREAHRLFMKLKTNTVAGASIIEAPAKGNPKKAQPQQLLQQQAILWKALTAPCLPVLYAVSVLALENKSILSAVL